MIKTFILIFTFSSMLMSENAELEIQNSDLPTETYRSDQFSPGVISEYIKLTLSSDRKHIKKIEYWYVYRDGNTGAKSEVYDLKFRKSERYAGEEVGNKGELLLPEAEEYVSFINAEGLFEITHEPERIQSFELKN